MPSFFSSTSLLLFLPSNNHKKFRTWPELNPKVSVPDFSSIPAPPNVRVKTKIIWLQAMRWLIHYIYKYIYIYLYRTWGSSSFKLFVKNKIKFHNECQLFHLRTPRQLFFHGHITFTYCVGTLVPFWLYPVLLRVITFVYFLSSQPHSVFNLTLKLSPLIWKGPSSVKRIGL